MRRRVAMLCGLGVLGCGGSAGPFPGYASVQAGSDCGPAGGAAVSLVFRPAPDSLDAMGPHLRVRIWQSPAETAGREFASTDRSPVGSAYECGDQAACSDLTTWRVRFDAMAPDSTLSGELEVTAADGTRRAGSFRARWQQRTLFCI